MSSGWRLCILITYYLVVLSLTFALKGYDTMSRPPRVNDIVIELLLLNRLYVSLSITKCVVKMMDENVLLNLNVRYIMIDNDHLVSRQNNIKMFR